MEYLKTFIWKYSKLFKNLYVKYLEKIVCIASS